MTRFLVRALLLSALLTMLAGCNGLKNCSSSAGVVVEGLFSTSWTISCSASYETLTETEFVRIDMEDIGPFVGQAEGRIGLVVDSGTAELSFTDGSGLPVTITASKGLPALYVGSVELGVGPAVRMELSPVGGPAENVRYEVTFAG